MAAEKRRFSFTNLFKNTTPKPQDRQIYNLGIQEKNTSYVINPTVIYNIASQSTILRTCTTQLKNEIFRRGYVWEEAFTVKCNDCGKVHKSATLECKDCGSTNLNKPDPKQLNYATKFLERYVNKSEQLFIDILKELEDDLNIMDDAYLRAFIKSFDKKILTLFVEWKASAEKSIDPEIFGEIYIQNMKKVPMAIEKPMGSVNNTE